ncbi:MAG: hypothetical protein J6Y94_07745 [Bacteriovoracaceae bacterium]|nr:hypothetical protein [Bacteriovoracaceae bacterium]
MPHQDGFAVSGQRRGFCILSLFIYLLLNVLILRFPLAYGHDCAQYLLRQIDGAKNEAWTGEEKDAWAIIQQDDQFSPARLKPLWKGIKKITREEQRLRLEKAGQILTHWLDSFKKLADETAFYKFYQTSLRTYHRLTQELDEPIKFPIENLAALLKNDLRLASDMDDLALRYRQGLQHLGELEEAFLQEFGEWKERQNEIHAAVLVQSYNAFLELLNQHLKERSWPCRLAMSAFTAYGPIYALQIAPPTENGHTPFTPGETALTEAISDIQQIFALIPVELRYSFKFNENFLHLAEGTSAFIGRPVPLLAQVENQMLTFGHIEVQLPLDLLARPLLGLSHLQHEFIHLKNFASIFPTSKNPASHHSTYPVKVVAGEQPFFPQRPGFYNLSLSFDEPFANHAQMVYLAQFVHLNHPDHEFIFWQHQDASLGGAALQEEVDRVIEIILQAFKEGRFDLALAKYPLQENFLLSKLAIFNPQGQVLFTAHWPLSKHYFAHLTLEQFWGPLQEHLTNTPTKTLPYYLQAAIIKVWEQHLQYHRLQLNGLDFGPPVLPK